MKNRRALRTPLMGALLVALLLVFALQLQNSQKESREDLLNRFADSAANNAALTGALFSSSATTSRSELEREFGSASISQSRVDRRIRRANSPYAVLVTKRGRVLAASSSAPATAIADIKKLPAHVEAAGGPQGFGLSDSISRPDSDPVNEFAQGFTAADSTRRVLVSAIAPTVLTGFLGQYLARTTRVKGGQAYITDSNGVVVAATTDTSLAVPGESGPDLLQRALEHRAGEHGDLRFASAPIEGTSWQVVVTAPSTELLAAVQGTNGWVPWLIFAAFALAAVTAIVFLRRMLANAAHLEIVNERVQDSNQLLEHDRHQLVEVQQLAHMGSWEWHLATGEVIWSDELYRILGVDRESFAASFESFLSCVHPDDREDVEREVTKARDQRSPLSFQHRIVRGDGKVRTLHLRGEVVCDEQGEPLLMRGAGQDITAQKSAEERFRGLLESAPDAMVIADESGVIVIVNSQALHLFGYSREELLGERIEALVPKRFQDAYREHCTGCMAEPAVRAMGSGLDVYARRKDGSEFPVEISLSPLSTDQGVLVSSAIRDITARKEAEVELEHQALHDPLTGLPNRVLLLDRLDNALERAKRPRSTLAVFFCDLDAFKVVNDSLGHGAGDALLAALTPRLHEAVRPGDTIARFGGDEFVVLCEGLESESDALRIAERIAQAFSQPIELDGREHFVSVSTGVVIVEGGEASVTEVLRDADAAMYQAKAKGRGRYEVFDRGMRKRLVERLDTENALRRAIEDDQLRLHYQPIVDIDDGSVIGAEALLRWERPNRGLQGPAEFIEIAEESGLIIPIGRWVLEEACRQAIEWNASLAATSPISVSVNLSPRQVSRSDMVATVDEVLRETGMDPRRLALEITEGALIGEAEDTLRDIKSLGVQLLLDDFGTGFSSLSYLNRFPIDSLKIDRSFIDGLDNEPEDSALVAAIISMAQSLKIGVVAEGIETPLQLARVRRLGCRKAQGFHFSKPVPPKLFAELLGQSKPDARRSPPLISA